MKFERKICEGVKDKFDTIEFPSFEDAEKHVHEMFYANDEYARMEEMHFENGKKSLSLKNRGNKILYQLKTIL